MTSGSLRSSVEPGRKTHVGSRMTQKAFPSIHRTTPQLGTCYMRSASPLPSTPMSGRDAEGLSSALAPPLTVCCPLASSQHLAALTETRSHVSPGWRTGNQVRRRGTTGPPGPFRLLAGRRHICTSSPGVSWGARKQMSSWEPRGCQVTCPASEQATFQTAPDAAPRPLCRRLY